MPRNKTQYCLVRLPAPKYNDDNYLICSLNGNGLYQKSDLDTVKRMYKELSTDYKDVEYIIAYAPDWCESV
jgi:hypothetical protein